MIAPSTNAMSTSRSRKNAPPTVGEDATCWSASTAYDTGRTSAAQRSTVLISSRGWNSPHNNSCGSTTTGISWIAWNSVVANAEANNPSATPSSASTSVTTTSHTIDPTTSKPNEVATT